jgi:phosphomevalonate kinase
LTGTKTGNSSLVLEGITSNRRALIQLGQQAGVPIETPSLSALAEAAERLGGAGKSSGAGAGDCGIALIDKSQANQLYTSWREVDIQPLSLHVPDNGLLICSQY